MYPQNPNGAFDSSGNRKGQGQSKYSSNYAKHIFIRV